MSETCTQPSWLAGLTTSHTHEGGQAGRRTFNVGRYSDASSTLDTARDRIANLCFKPGLVVMGDNSCLRGCGFKSRRHILDGHDIFNLVCCKNCIVCLRRSKINEKEDGVGQFKKSLFPLTREA